MNIHLSGSKTCDPFTCLLFNSDDIRRHWRGSRDEGLWRESRIPSQLWFPHPWDLGWTYTQIPGGKKAASHGTCLVAPWLGPRDPKAGGPGSILGQGPRSHMLAPKTGTGKSIKKAKIAFKEPMITAASLSYYEIRGQNGTARMPAIFVTPTTCGGGRRSFLLCPLKVSVPFRRSVVSDSLRPHGLQPARPPCPSPTHDEFTELMSIESVMPSNHLILCHPLLLLPSTFPSIRVFSNESALHMRWPKFWSFSFNISPSSEHPGLISYRMGWLDLLAAQGTLNSLLQHHSSKVLILWRSAFFTVQLSHP